VRGRMAEGWAGAQGKGCGRGARAPTARLDTHTHTHTNATPPPGSSFFQSVCVLGYCVCPLVIAAVLGLMLTGPVLRIPLVLGAFVWSCRASVVFMKEMVPSARRLLAVYPVCLFYMMVAWMVFMV
jgi:hypothetical protein